MTAILLDGKALAQTMQAEIAVEAAAFTKASGVRPGLAAVLVGDNPQSQSYVKSKQKACEKAGIASWLHPLPPSTSQTDLLALVARLNADPAVHGILVQLPLPPHIDEASVVDAVSPYKDVDGFGPESLGLLAAGRPRFLACTPYGVQQLLVRNRIPLAGAHVVVIGRSNIVGRPLSLILSQKGVDATVTLCHSRSRDVAALTRTADIVVAAIGKLHYLRADMVRPGAVVVDVGMNRTPDGRWAGDADFDALRPIASAITPVPGGVGPMTITMLLHNTVRAATLRREAGARRYQSNAASGMMLAMRSSAVAWAESSRLTLRFPSFRWASKTRAHPASIDVININVSHATRWGLNSLILFSVILALYLGSTIFIPTIISVLLAAILWPLVTWLNKRGVPLPGMAGGVRFPWLRPCLWRLRMPWAAACLATVSGLVVCSLLVAGGFGLLISKFVLDVGAADKQVKMYGAFRDKAAQIVPLIRDDDLYFNKDPDDSRIYNAIKSYFDTTKPAFTEMVTNIGATTTTILWDAILILFVLLFLLIEGKMLSRHLVSIFGPTDGAQRRAVAALKDMATQIRSYVVWRTIINFSMALFLGMLYWYLGLTQPWAWALLTAVLWYVPYIGPIMAGFPPVIDAFLNCPSPWTPVGILVFYTLFVMLEGYFVVPVVMGRSMELNATTVMLACLFWYLVWGVPGMFLALPLMAALRTICMHVPDWHPWANLMGTRENPPPPKHDPEEEPPVLKESFFEDTQILTGAELRGELASGRPVDHGEESKKKMV